MRLVLLIVLVLLVLGALPTWPYSADWGYYPSSGLGLVVVVLLVLIVPVPCNVSRPEMPVPLFSAIKFAPSCMTMFL